MSGYNFHGMTPDDLRAQAKTSRQQSYDSFQRSDTDGFLSQAASDVSADVYELQADIIENGGRSLFLALFDLEGNVVPAVRMDSQYDKYADVWGILDPAQPYGRFVSWFNPSKAKREGVARANDAKKGYYIGYAEFPARATVGGRYTWFARAERLDERDFSDVVAIDNGVDACEDAERWYRVQDGRFTKGQ